MKKGNQMFDSLGRGWAMEYESAIVKFLPESTKTSKTKKKAGGSNRMPKKSLTRKRPK